MGNILLKSATFLFLIVLGYILKRVRFFGPEDYKIPVKIVLNVTMPCAVLVSFAAYKPDLSLLVIVLIAFSMNCILLFISYLLSKKCPRHTRAVWLNCVPGNNIGAFAMPFVQSFLTPASLVATCLYDIGNAIMCCGTTYAISKNILDGTKGIDLKKIGKTLLRSVPFLSYFIMLLITVFRIPIPDTVVTFVAPIANANAFLAMFMVGMMLDLNIEKSVLRQVGGMLTVRYVAAALAAVAIYFLLPLELPIRQALCITVFAPVSMVSTAFTPGAGGDPAVTACCNSVSILISIPCMIGLLAVFGIL